MATAVLPDVVYPESDREPMAETQIHGNTMFDVYSRLTARYADAADGYARKGFDIIKPTKGRLVSKTLGVTLERDGTMLRLRDAATGAPLLLPAEQHAAEAERKAAKAERKVDRSERKVVRLTAAADQLLAAREAERLAREAAEAEVAKLEAELAALRKGM